MRPLPHKIEIIAMMAMAMATIAFSIDAMLPALPQIAEQLSPGDVNRAQFVVTSFVFGMGLGTLFTGPLSDRFGRKPVVLVGAVLYVLAALVGAYAQSLEVLLLARAVQGVGAAGPRVAAMAILRDLYAGREMARTVSFVMIIFTLVPAIAPLLGALLIAWNGWPMVFWAFAVFCAIAALWLGIRLPETLAEENRRPFALRSIWAAIVELVTHPVVKYSILAQGFCFAVLFSTISLVQPIYDTVFDRADSFPYWFGGIAVVAGSSGFVNAALVMRLGMRKLVSTMLRIQLVLSSAFLIGLQFGLDGDQAFYAFVFWQTGVFFQAGLTLGNLNAIAMEPMGHIAGLAASVMGSLATVMAVVLTAPISLSFNGTPFPLIIGVLGFSIGGLLMMKRMPDTT